MAKGNARDNFKKDKVDGYDVFRFSTRPLGNIAFLNPLNRFLSLFIWAYKAKKFKPDIISGHDLIPLLIGWLSNVGRKNKAKLVYDSHEFEMGRNANRTKLATWIIKAIERFLIKRSAFSIMVNNSIADEVSKIYKLKKRPVVVRNTPSNWVIDEKACAKTRRYYLKTLGIIDDCFICMYHGAILSNRGIEELIEVISRTENTAGIILGNGAPEYIQNLKELSVKLNVSNRILFLPVVKVEELVNYVGASDCGILTPRIVYKSYYFGLGNKFFENIQSLTPIICNNTPEMTNIVNKYKIGLTVNPSSIDEIVNTINKMKNNKNLYLNFKKNLKKAKNDLCWENEKQILIKAYKKLFLRIINIK